jgi:hypothetical protein
MERRQWSAGILPALWPPASRRHRGLNLNLVPKPHFLLGFAKVVLQLGRPMNFYTVLESAIQRKEIAIGFRLKSESNDPSRSYGVSVNPKKSEMITFSEGDKIIVLAED